MGIFKRERQQESPPEEKKDDQSALLDAFAAKLEEHLKPIRESVASVKSFQDNLEAELSKPPDTNETPGELTPEQRTAREILSLRQDNALTRAMLVERTVLDSIESDWQHLKPELAAIFSKTPVSAKAAPNYGEMCQNAVNVLIGREIRKGGVRRDTQGKFFIEESISSEADRDNPVNQIPTWQSDDRVETASETLDKLGIKDKTAFASDWKNGRLM